MIPLYDTIVFDAVDVSGSTIDWITVKKQDIVYIDNKTIVYIKELRGKDSSYWQCMKSKNDGWEWVETAKFTYYLRSDHKWREAEKRVLKKDKDVKISLRDIFKKSLILAINLLKTKKS